MKKGITASALIRLVIMIVILVILFNLLSVVYANIMSADLRCSWSVHLVARGIPFSELKCNPQVIELSQDEAEDTQETKAIIAEEMAQCYAKFGSGRYDQILKGQIVYLYQPGRTVANIFSYSAWIDYWRTAREPGCFVCAEIAAPEGHTINLENLDSYLRTNDVPYLDKTYHELIYQHDSLDSEKHERMRRHLNNPTTGRYAYVFYTEQRGRNAVVAYNDLTQALNDEICARSIQ